MAVGASQKKVVATSDGLLGVKSQMQVTFRVLKCHLKIIDQVCVYTQYVYEDLECLRFDQCKLNFHDYIFLTYLLIYL